MKIRQRNEDDKFQKHQLRAHREAEEMQKRAVNENQKEATRQAIHS